ncbi:hypothetical protein [Ruminococcus sp.]|uniref:hypothetical protein n=1 Tax=Ruminococcus sp. TaxID=41978 RepID=UPI0025D09886|nr:hypothetical protein [Ruminococcus sp.]
MNKLYSVVYSPKAKDDLKEIYTYIAFYTVDTRSLTVTVLQRAGHCKYCSGF